jgi:4-amino-4-deoxy-L-arabinose transferase-like glycosyltransferase
MMTIKKEDELRGKIWLIFAVAAMILVITAAICWSLHHPYGTSWDEAQYLNESQIDAQRLQHGLLIRLAGRILIKSFGRPPAYRIFALPLLGLFGFHTALVRLASLTCFALSSLFVFLSARRIQSTAAGGFAVLIFCLSPTVISASMWFSTEGPLYVATSAMLYYVLKIWEDESDHWSTWVGLGLAIGVGFLAKASYLMIVIPVAALWLLAGRRRQLGIPSLASQWKAGLVALLVAGPWWILNIKPAISYTQYARGFVANSLGPPSPSTWLMWLWTVVQSLLGYGLSIVIVLVAIAMLRLSIKQRRVALAPFQKLAVVACICAGAPLVLAQLIGTNDLLRHISPAVIPLAIAVGAMADWTGWARAKLSIAISGVLFCGQLAMILAPFFFPSSQPAKQGTVNGKYPWRVMALVDQWDWTPIENISRKCNVDSPKISYLGDGSAFNPPQIERPWVATAASTGLETFPFPDVTWLWRYEEGQIDWQKVMAAAEGSDLVITAPSYIGEVGDSSSNSNNQNNSEFAERLYRDSHFQKPVPLLMGRFEPVEVLVFVNVNRACYLGDEASASR